jgi:hypothetical protein
MKLSWEISGHYCPDLPLKGLRNDVNGVSEDCLYLDSRYFSIVLLPAPEQVTCIELRA